MPKALFMTKPVSGCRKSGGRISKHAWAVPAWIVLPDGKPASVLLPGGGAGATFLIFWCKVIERCSYHCPTSM
jgi:hypothetical protein